MREPNDPDRGDIEDEVAFHLEMRTRELVAQGVAPERARREARRRFGNAQRVKLDCRQLGDRDARHGRRRELLGEVRQDVKLGLRRLVQAPGFTLLAVLILALGIGANSSIFSVLDAVVMRPLPWAEPDRLVRIWDSSPSRGWDFFAVSQPNYVDYRARNESFAAMAAIGFVSFNTRIGDQVERVEARAASSDFFATLGIEPALGRAFTHDEDAPRAEERIALLGHGLWQRRFGADPDVVGREILLDDAPFEVIGVMPPGGELWLDDLELLVPLRADPDASRSDHRLAVVGRLLDGVSPTTAEADLDAIAAALAIDYPDDNAGFDTRVMPLFESIVPAEIRRALYTLLGAVGLVLLIACANLSNLLLSRAVGRTREVAVAIALGATRARIARQFLTEAALLSLLGGGAGVLLAYRALDAFRALDPARLPRFETLEIDGGVLLLTLLVALGTGLAAGAVPAWQAAGADPNATLNEAGRGASAGARSRRARQVLLVAEVALSVVLLVGAGLLIRSFWRVQGVDPGLRTANVLTLGVNTPIQGEEDYRRVPAQYRATIERLEALPGVVSAGATSGLPFGSGDTSLDFYRADSDPDPDGVVPSAGWRLVTPGALETLGIPLVRGRWFDEADGPEIADTAVISSSMARQYWPGEDPIGKRFLAWRDPDRVKTIIGVVGDVRERSLEAEGRHIVYMPFLQMPWWPSMFLVVRTEGDPAALATEVRATVARTMPERPVSDMRPLEAVLDDTLATRRFNTLLLIAFAAVALLLAALGVYGVMAYSVTQRTSEIGIRMAMGASVATVVGMVLAQGARVVLIGIALGIAGALAGTRLLASLLYGVEPTDAVSLGAAVLFLLAIALVACLVPALRAVRMDPSALLRES